MDARDRELLIRLDTKLDILTKDVKEIRDYQEKHDGRIRAVEISLSNITTQG